MKSEVNLAAPKRTFADRSPGAPTSFEMAAAMIRLGAMTPTVTSHTVNARANATRAAHVPTRTIVRPRSTTRRTFPLAFSTTPKSSRGVSLRAPAVGETTPPGTEEDIDDDFVPEKLGIKDIISLWITQILQTYGDEESKDGAPVCEGSVDDLVGGPIFLALYPYFLKYGGVFKLAFGPKVFMVLSDPVIVREVLKEKPFAFSKGEFILTLVRAIGVTSCFVNC